MWEGRREKEHVTTSVIGNNYFGVKEWAHYTISIVRALIHGVVIVPILKSGPSYISMHLLFRIIGLKLKEYVLVLGFRFLDIFQLYSLHFPFPSSIFSRKKHLNELQIIRKISKKSSI